ncbi:MAG TPA: hypothetical protein VF452_14975 [Candidatus Binatia bacterium]
MKLHRPKLLPSLFFLCGCLAGTSIAYSQAPFYQGKTITVIVGTSPAGTGDLRVKALIPFLRKHIPGNPALVLEYMDGGDLNGRSSRAKSSSRSNRLSRCMSAPTDKQSAHQTV